MKSLRLAIREILKDKLLLLSTIAITLVIYASLIVTPSPWYVCLGLLSYYPGFVLFTTWLDVSDKRWLYPGIKDDEENS